MTQCFHSGLFRITPIVHNQVRFAHNRPNIQRPKFPHFLKNKFLQVCKPIKAEDTRPLVEKCTKQEEFCPPYSLDLLDKIYASELRDLFKTSKLSAVFSRTTNNWHEQHQANIYFFKANMKTLIRTKHIVREAIGDTEYRNLLPLFETNSFMVFSNEANIASLVQIDQKLPLFQLYCAVVDGRILSNSQLKALAAIPDLSTAQVGVVQTLQSGAQNVAHCLQSHQNNLVQCLRQRADQLESPQRL